MKRAVILHGTDASPRANWFQWLKSKLEEKYYEVWVPELPSNHTPSKEIYNNFLFSNNWDFSDNLIIGHSSGAVSILNLLEDNRCPHVKAAVLVGAWSHMEETDLDKEQFKNLFPKAGFDFQKIKRKADKMLFLHGDDDPYCPLEQAKWLADQTRSEIIILPGGEHLGSTRTPEFPELLEALEQKIDL